MYSNVTKQIVALAHWLGVMTRNNVTLLHFTVIVWNSLTSITKFIKMWTKIEIVLVKNVFQYSTFMTAAKQCKTKCSVSGAAGSGVIFSTSLVYLVVRAALTTFGWLLKGRVVSAQFVLSTCCHLFEGAQCTHECRTKLKWLYFFGFSTDSVCSQVEVV